jgi:hypothetical protein
MTWIIKLDFWVQNSYWTFTKSFTYFDQKNTIIKIIRASNSFLLSIVLIRNFMVQNVFVTNFEVYGSKIKSEKISRY